MISPQSDLVTFGQGKIKFFDYRPRPHELGEISSFQRKISKCFPEDSPISVNFFKDGDNIHGEALVSSGDNLIVSRSMKNSLKDSMDQLFVGLVKKANSNEENINNSISDWSLELTA